MPDLPASELDEVVAAGADLWGDLDGARLLLTGATGFFGLWLLATLGAARRRHGLDVAALALTRDAARARTRLGGVADEPWLTLVEGDVRSFEPPAGPLTHVVHGAADADARLNREQPALVLETALEGTRRVLDAAVRAGAARFLLVSSGAAYGRQPPEVARLDEDAPIFLNPLEPDSAYGEGKRLAEFLAILASRDSQLEVSVARCFAFLGPGLPLDGAYAAGNFVGDALAGRPVRVAGDGTARRSYLYSGDLALWLWTILLRGRPARVYNVGSEDEFSISELARLVSRAVTPSVPVEIACVPDPAASVRRYIPSTRRAREELGLRRTVDLVEAIRRTIAWSG